jgi:putative FmdB family regulatory protein
VEECSVPTYEYECQACGHEFEKFQSMTDRPVRKCPECGRMRVKRLIGTGAGLLFKGDGFYITDYRSKGYQEAAKKDTASSASASETKKTDSSSKTTAKSESKSAPKKN